MLNNLEIRNMMQVNIHEQNTKGENFYTTDFLELVIFLTMNFLQFFKISENRDK